MTVPGNVLCGRDLGIKTRLCLRSVRGWGMRGQQGLTVRATEMVAVQKDIASNLAWRREVGDGLFFLFVGFFFWGEY